MLDMWFVINLTTQKVIKTCQNLETAKNWRDKFLKEMHQYRLADVMLIKK